MVLDVQPDSLLLAGDVARAFGVSAEAVRKWERAGRLAALRTIGGVRLFRGDAVLEFQRNRAADRLPDGLPR